MQNERRRLPGPEAGQRGVQASTPIQLAASVSRAPNRDARRAEVRRSFITTTVREESQVTPQGHHR